MQGDPTAFGSAILLKLQIYYLVERINKGSLEQLQKRREKFAFYLGDLCQTSHMKKEYTLFFKGDLKQQNTYT